MKDNLITPAESVLPVDFGGALPKGVVHLANESRFNAAHLSEPLTEYASGWVDDSDIVRSLEFVAPTVRVGRRFEYRQATNADEFRSELDDIRSIGGSFKQVEARGTLVNSKTDNKGLTVFLDKDDLFGPDEERRAVGWLLRRLYRNELRRAVTALLAIDNTGTAKVWAASGGTDCDSDVTAAAEAAADAAGIRPNRVLYGSGAYQLREAAYASLDKAGAFAGLMMTEERLAQRLRVDGVLVSRERYQSAVASKSKITGDVAVVFFGMANPMKNDPSSLKRFVTPIGSGLYRVFREERSTGVAVTVEHYSTIATTATVGTKKLTITAS